MLTLFLRDLKLSIRSGGGFGLALAFFLIVVMFVPFGVGADRALLARIAPGLLWIAALLACLLSLDRLFQPDAEDGTLEVLATAPLPLSGSVVAKSAAHWVTTGLPLTLIAVPLGLFLNLPVSAYLWVFASLGVGTPALSFIGAFGAALTVGIKRGGLLLSLLVLPLYIPTLIFGAVSASMAANGLNPLYSFLILAGLTCVTLVFMPIASVAVLRTQLE